MQPPDQKKAARSNAQRARTIVGWLAIPLTVLMLYSTVNETVNVLDYEVPVGVVMLIMWVLGGLAILGENPHHSEGLTGPSHYSS